MFTLVVIIVLALITLMAISLQKAYNHLPVKELKRRARHGDQLATLLHRAVAYGMSLDVLLWLIIGLSASGFFVVLAHAVPAWLAVVISFSLVWFAFGWLPNSRITVIGEYSARFLTPFLAWLLRYLQPVLGRIAQLVHEHGRLTVHTGLYQKEDLLDLLKDQKKQLDNRITKDELRIASGALRFSDKLVSDVMTPRRVIKSVKADDSIGPVLMTELHKTGHSRYPVYDGKKDNIIGILYLRDVVSAKAGGSVRNVMSKKVYYVNESLRLGHVLDAFLKTKHHMFIVVNEFEEIAGLITIEDILEQIIGKPIIDEFDKFEDLRAVAQLEAKKDGLSREKAAEAEEAAKTEKPSK